MIFCRIEHGDYEPIFVEGITPKLAFSHAKDSAEFEIGPECNITFWDAKKMDIKVKFSIEIVE